MRKAIIAAVAAIAAIALTPMLAASWEVAHADPCCTEGDANARVGCITSPEYNIQQCLPGAGATPPQVTTQAPATRPVQTPQAPPPPPPPSVVPVQTPKINPPAPGAPRNAAVVAPPNGLDAPPQSIAAAKATPATRIDPATPPPPPTQVNFGQQVQKVISAHSTNIDVVKADNQALVRPRHWDYIDYDVYHRPMLYNPLTEAMTFRYFYGGDYREVYVPAGGQIVLDVASVGMYPFTAVSDNYLTSGSFYGGAYVPPDGWNGPPPPDYTPPPPPAVYHDVSAYIPADNQTVQVPQVQVVGHDDSQPAGSQDTFMLDDSTLAWGQANDPSSGSQITVTKTQSLPGVGPTDNGSYLVALATPQQPTHTWWPWALGGALVVAAVGLLAWVVIRRKRSADLVVSG